VESANDFPAANIPLLVLSISKQEIGRNAMRVITWTTAVAVCSLTLLQTAAQSADIKIILAGGLGPVVTAVKPAFEKESGNKLDITFVSGPVVKREVEGGRSFDIAISQPEIIDELIAGGKIVAGSRTDIARTGIGLSVKAGAPKPDISSVDAFKKTLVSVKSIAHSKEGASGAYFMKLLDRLQLTSAVQPKLVGAPAGAGGLVSPVLKGEAEVVVGTASAIMEPGIDFVALIPDDLQNWSVFSAGYSTASAEPKAAQEFVAYLKSAKSLPIIKEKAMQPMTP
jgi:molybdate transport system substrate-binding protein